MSSTFKALSILKSCKLKPKLKPYSTNTKTNTTTTLSDIYINGVIVGFIGSFVSSMYVSYKIDTLTGLSAFSCGVVASLTWPITFPIIGADLVGRQVRQ